MMKLALTAAMAVVASSVANATVLALQPSEPWTKLKRRPDLELVAAQLFRLAGRQKSVPVVIDPAAAGSCAYATTTLDGRDYIGVDPACVGPLYRAGHKNWNAVGVMGHEVGHLIAKHPRSRGDSHTQETEADEWSGWALQKMGATLEQAVHTTDDFPASVSRSHPGRSTRVESYARGWMKAKAGHSVLSFQGGNWWTDFMAMKLPWAR